MTKLRHKLGVDPTLVSSQTAVTHYLQNTAESLPIREIARRSKCHPSTILRQIRKVEDRREDPLIDAALDNLSHAPNPILPIENKDISAMKSIVEPILIPNEETLQQEARRILRRLCEKTAILAVGKSLGKAVVMKQTAPGSHSRVAVLDQEMAQAFALRDWIVCIRKGKVSTYEITHAGKSALKRMIAEDKQHRLETNAQERNTTAFQEQHKIWGERLVSGPKGNPSKRLRYNLAESPLTVLGRKKMADGQPFLSEDLLIAGERLREDFELAQLGPRVTQNWEGFLTYGSTGFSENAGPSEGPRGARARVSLALRDLGPGLGDIALRCCCHLEGLEAAEKRMGWSARSGKIVLRIALQRLKIHYEATNGFSETIG